ncbi:probable F-box protein At1g44080 [Dendrobium catenatum]|uniref:F-box protein n=1 Tax=Dendrobium catenatum TaxID=906689 RepID=A0A2I0VRX1_9ASPA|nr:probable F-box protein At1g44080 [Dendrobium catenatum]PKU66153.1 Putative F-box protein [Dendrobium catenatum]
MPSCEPRWMPDWSVLPRDLLLHISEHFTTFVDFIRFRSVCSSWRSAASTRRVPPSLPLLAFPPVDPDDSNPTCFFLSVSEARFLKQCLPNSCRDKRFIGSANGWFVMRGKDPFTSDASLLNPLTGTEIHLPPLCPHHFGRTGVEFVFKIVVSSPVAAGQISAIAILGCSMQLALTRPGADEWTLFGSSPNYQDALFFGGRFLVVDRFKRVFACEVDESSGPRLVEVMRYVSPIPFLWRERCYLVDSAGELMMVIRLFDATNAVKTTGFEVFKVDPNHRNQWIEVSSLGDRSLFVGLNRSISIRAREHPGCIENCIYFADDDFSHSGWFSGHKFDIGVFNLGNSSIDFFPDYHSKEECYFSRPSLWFSPSLV